MESVFRLFMEASKPNPFGGEIFETPFKSFSISFVLTQISRIQIHMTDDRKQFQQYRKISNISRISVGNKIIDHSDIVGASPVGAVPTTSSFLTNTWLQWIGHRRLKDETRRI